MLPRGRETSCGKGPVRVPAAACLGGDATESLGVVSICDQEAGGSVADAVGNDWFCLFVLVPKWCLTLCDPVDCSPLSFSVHGISQAKILEWVAIFFSGDRTQVSCISR